MIAEHSLVTLNCDSFEDEGLHRGDVGTVVHVYDGVTYEVEFTTGEETMVKTLTKNDISDGN